MEENKESNDWAATEYSQTIWNHLAGNPPKRKRSRFRTWLKSLRAWLREFPIY